MTRMQLFKEMYELSCHNLLCYSQDYLMSKPKSGYNKQWNKENEKVKLLQELISEEKQKKEIKNNSKIEETEELEWFLDVKQYEESDIYKEVKIIIPREFQELKKDFQYLDLDYENLSIQDTHIIGCEFIDKENPQFSDELSTKINNLITKSSVSGYTTTFQDMKKFYGVIKNFEGEDKSKLLSILEANTRNINTIKDAIIYSKNIDCFELIEVDDKKELARYLVHNGEIDCDDLMDYADMERLGDDYAKDKNMKETQQGFLSQNSNLKYSYMQEEEEFE